MDISLTLVKKYPEAEWVLVGTDYEGLEWLDDSPKPTKKELLALWPDVEETVQAEQNAKTTARESALAKLTALGLTEEEIAAL
jgi:DNA-binding NarL/FixJ family response regulator